MKLPVAPKGHRIFIGAVAFLAAICFLGINKAYGDSPGATTPGCQILSTKTISSPDYAWDAVVHDDFCEFGYAFSSSADYSVHIVSRSNPKKEMNVYATSDTGNPADEPIVSWISKDTLLISTLKDPFSGIQENKFEKIKIQYTYRAAPPLPTRVPTSTP